MEFIYPRIAKKANMACVYQMIIGDAGYKRVSYTPENGSPANSKKINQFDADGNLVKTHPSIMAAARYFGVSDHKHIKRVANGKEGVCKTYRGFTLEFA